MDRQQLREKILKLFRAVVEDDVECETQTDAVLAIIPDIEEATERLRAQVPNLIEEVKEQNTEQIDAMLVEARRTAKKAEGESIRTDILAIDYSSSNPLDYWGQITRLAKALKETEGEKE